MTNLFLPIDAEARAENFTRLSAVTKKQLLDTLKGKSAEDQSQIMEGILRQGGAASEFFQFILSKETDRRMQNNKRSNPIHTK